MTLFDRAVKLTLPYVPKTIVRKVADRYIAGETSEDALRVAARLNQSGIRATMDVLGEDIYNLDQARKAADCYVDLLDQIHARGIDSNVSIKLSQFGLKVDRNACVTLVSSLVRHAATMGNFVRIDMEDATTTTATLEIYRELRRTSTNVGVVIQAYLHRTLSDVASLEDLPPHFRLCKGVYVESPSIAYKEMPLINQNYLAILERLFRQGIFVGIATHDEFIVREALALIRRLRVQPSAYEFQMLLGVTEGLRDRIRSEGHNVRVYIPFGQDWYAYSVRRLRENPRIAGYVLKAMLSRKNA